MSNYSINGFLTINQDRGYISAVTSAKATIITDLNGNEIPRKAGFTFDYYQLEDIPERCQVRFIVDGITKAVIETTKAELILTSSEYF